MPIRMAFRAIVSSAFPSPTHPLGQGAASGGGSSADLAVWAIWIAVASFALSLLNFVLRSYRDDFRGAKVKLRLLMPPRAWDVRVFASPAAQLVEVGLGDPVPDGTVVINASGECGASLV